MKKKRLMILIWNMGIGGVQKRVRDIVLDIAENRSDWEIHLLVKFKKPSYFIEEIIAKTDTHLYFFSTSHKKSKSLPSVFWIAKCYSSIKPDVCLTFLDHLSIIMVGLRFIFFWQKTRLILNEGIYTSKYLKIYRRRPRLWKLGIMLTYRFAETIIVPTQAIRADLIINFHLPESKIVVIPNWTLFKPRSCKKPKYDLLFVGRFEKEKNLMQLLEVVKQLKKLAPDIKLCLVGSGRLNREIRKTAKNLVISKNIFLAGFQEDPVPFYTRSKLLVLPTLNEGMPNVVLEAAMCSVPVVANSFDGWEEVIQQGKTGYVVDEILEMTDYIHKLLVDESKRKKMGKQAQSFVARNFSHAVQKRFIDEILS